MNYGNLFGLRKVIDIVEEDLEEIFKKAKKIKPKHNLTAEQMDKLIGDEILDNLDIPREEP